MGLVAELAEVMAAVIVGAEVMVAVYMPTTGDGTGAVLMSRIDLRTQGTGNTLERQKHKFHHRGLLTSHSLMRWHMCNQKAEAAVLMDLGRQEAKTGRESARQLAVV
mmetsp:Transcript_15080/g.36002  ORF Transcript_15080/g.36002 Transcript_15080/m.36002 type:complete len:107 (-) Transcript_15080:617-937(-)